MNIILLLVGIIAGAVIGYLMAGRKAAALKTQVEAAEAREALLNRTAEERIARERSVAAKQRNALAHKNGCLPNAFPNRHAASTNASPSRNVPLANASPSSNGNGNNASPNRKKKPKPCTSV